MLSVTRDRSCGGQVVVTATGLLDEDSVEALLRAVALAPEGASIVIDLSHAQLQTPGSLRLLAVGLTQRQGQVSFRGPTWAQALSGEH